MRFAHAQPTGVTGYEATSIGVLEGFLSSDTWALDEYARLVAVVGRGPYQWVVWINGELHRVPPPPGAESASASAISPTTGYIVGTCLVNGQSRPAAWRIGGDSAILERLPGSQTACLLQDVNDSGWISGWCDFPNRAALWRRLEPPIDLGTLGGRGHETASGINAHGEIVGSSDNAQSIARPYLWRNGQMIDIGGEPANATGYAYGINDRTEVVGETSIAFHWSSGRITRLPSFGPCAARPLSNNYAGLIVGHDNRDDRCRSGYEHAVAWEHKGQEFVEYDVNDFTTGHPDVTLIQAKDINDAGQMAAYGKLANGQGRGFLVTPYLFETSDPVPGRAGTQNTITATGLAPNQRVHLVWGTREGAQKIHSGCPGGTLLIRDPQALPSVRADANGVATINVNVPLIARGRTVRLQAVAPIECQISHTVTWTFE
ncbi:MAG: hypothetical protein KJZ69_06820 [Phycisphaerales bacterium]|nr:hypothetical protein [Phycisphaerales bacterium]